MDKNYEHTPAYKVIKAAGSGYKLAQMLNLPRSWISRWLQPKEKLGTDGGIPRKHHRKILDLSAEHGWNITAEDLIY